MSTAAEEAECTAESEGSCKHGGCRAQWPRFVVLGRRYGIPTRREPCAERKMGRRGRRCYGDVVEDVVNAWQKRQPMRQSYLHSYSVAVSPGDDFGILKREHAEDLRGVTWHISARRGRDMGIAERKEYKPPWQPRQGCRRYPRQSPQASRLGKKVKEREERGREADGCTSRSLT